MPATTTVSDILDLAEAGWANGLACDCALRGGGGLHLGHFHASCHQSDVEEHEGSHVDEHRDEHLVGHRRPVRTNRLGLMQGSEEVHREVDQRHLNHGDGPEDGGAASTDTGIVDNLTYYLYPSEAVDQRADFPDGERFRLAGLVVEGSLTDDDGDLTFEVTDGGATVPVVLVDTPPPLFNEEVPVLLEGSWNGEVYTADEAFIRHDENYEIPAEGNYEESQ